MRIQNTATTSTSSGSEDDSAQTIENNVNNLDQTLNEHQNHNKLKSPKPGYQNNSDTDSEDDTSSLSDWTDSDDDNHGDNDDQIDIQLLHDLENIQISLNNNDDKSEVLIPKGPQKIHKIRKQGKSQCGPYHQGPQSSSLNNTSSSNQYLLPNIIGGSAFGGGDKMDLVLSESLNDPGFRSNLLHTLQAEIEPNSEDQQYPKLITPPLSSTDCVMGYSNWYNPSSNTYYQYTPESLQSDSPHGSDMSLEEEIHILVNNETTDGTGTKGRFKSNSDSLYQGNQTHSSNSSICSINNLSPNYSSNFLYTPESLQNSPPQQSSFGSGKDNLNALQENDFQQSIIEQHNETLMKMAENQQVQLSQEENWTQNNVEEEKNKKLKSNAENFISNILTGVKFFLSSYVNVYHSPEEPIIPYDIDLERANRLKLLAKIIQNKLDYLDETEKSQVSNLNVEDEDDEKIWNLDGYFVQKTQMSGGQVYHFPKY